MLDHKALIEHCQQGNRDAQRTLFERFASKMLTVCRRYAKSEEEAEDMLQEGFIKLFRNLHQFKGKGSFEGWVRRIFVNCAIKQYHKAVRHNSNVELKHISHMTTEPTALDQMSEEELMDLIRSLPEGYRVVFNLYAVEGYPHKEISAMLGIQESTSRSQLVKARKWLQARILEQQKVTV